MTIVLDSRWPVYCDLLSGVRARTSLPRCPISKSTRCFCIVRSKRRSFSLLCVTIFQNRFVPSSWSCLEQIVPHDLLFTPSLSLRDPPRCFAWCLLVLPPPPHHPPSSAYTRRLVKSRVGLCVRGCSFGQTWIHAYALMSPTGQAAANWCRESRAVCEGNKINSNTSHSDVVQVNTKRIHSILHNFRVWNLRISGKVLGDKTEAPIQTPS